MRRLESKVSIWRFPNETLGTKLPWFTVLAQVKILTIFKQVIQISLSFHHSKLELLTRGFFMRKTGYFYQLLSLYFV